MSNSAINYVLFVFVKSENVNNKLPGKSKGRKKNKIIYFIVRVSKSWNSSGKVMALYAASRFSSGRSTTPRKVTVSFKPWLYQSLPRGQGRLKCQFNFLRLYSRRVASVPLKHKYFSLFYNHKSHYLNHKKKVKALIMN